MCTMNLDPMHPELSPLTLPDVPSDTYPHHLHVFSLSVIVWIRMASIGLYI